MLAKETLCKRKERRFKTCDGQSLQCDTVVQENTVVDDGDSHQGTVIDISPSGLRFLCEGKFRTGQTFSTELKTDRSHGTFRGVIRRVEPWVGGQSILGCQLLDAIPEDVLGELAGEGVVNRRSDDRIVWNQPAKMSWELEPGDIDINIQDCSPGGMKITTEHAIPDTVRLRIHVDMGDDEQMIVDARRVWQTEDENGCVAGLAFTKRDTPEAVSRILEQHESQPDIVFNTENGLTLRRCLLVAATIAVFGLALVQTSL